MGKKKVCLSVDRDIIALAHKNDINVSRLLEETLERELSQVDRHNYIRSLEKFKQLIDSWIKERGLQRDFDEWKYK